MPKITFFLLALVYTNLHASQVLVVSKNQNAFLASPDQSKKWKVGEALCAKDSHGVGGCGKIVKVTNKGFFVTVSFKKSEIMKGMEVLRIKKLPEASTLPTRTVELSLGAQASFFYLIPYLKVEFKLVDHLGLGFQPSLFIGSGTDAEFKAVGLGLATTLYQKENLEGFLASVAFVPYYYSMTVSGQSSTNFKFGGTFSAGYLVSLNSSLTLSGALGVQYLPFPDLLNSTFEYTSVQPYGAFSVGFLF